MLGWTRQRSNRSVAAKETVVDQENAKAFAWMVVAAEEVGLFPDDFMGATDKTAAGTR